MAQVSASLSYHDCPLSLSCDRQALVPDPQQLVCTGYAAAIGVRAATRAAMAGLRVDQAAPDRPATRIMRVTPTTAGPRAAGVAG
jgi:hypothetical protein